MARLALFDLDNTLVERSAAFASWTTEFVAAHDLPPGAAAWLLTRDADGATPRNRFFTEVRDRFRLQEPMQELWRSYRRSLPEHITVRPGVLAMLADLRHRGWRLAVATNGRPDNQLAKLHRTGLAAAVDGWAISGELGVRKPDRALFAAAAEACGADLAAGGWMTGDNPEHDIAGAHAAGLHTIWISRGRTWPAGRPSPDHTCAAVEAAAAVLRGAA
ncbi:HAD family hydrolase [Dactylosporangium matsuzakiense]|uniref:Hydrolase of the HAD superfamily n=1 Tax=Dactylosporangium matsuzakiense TaxID=53360 RepID=A0A9W6KHW3_9ACTN|nr:HAD family hydrolase [Dactylosporangium matsuzakiense]UWZ48816.1 HAD family hydrolase [Dactylosporangium matsuzakiense]GLL01080.1 hypothetical protein GCM10017581_028210 [Dactylosporangium matsuzakiense]